MKLKLEHTILLLILCAGTAAAVLGILAFRLARHEAAYQKQELANLLQSECKVFADRCRTTLDTLKTDLIQKTADATPTIRGINDAVRREPLFAEGFFTTSAGVLRHPSPSTAFARRYDELFSGMISSRYTEADLFSNLVVPADSAAYIASRTLAKRDDSRKISPIAAARAPLQSSDVRKYKEVKKERTAPAEKMQMKPSPPAEMTAQENMVKKQSVPAMLRRFTAITRNRRAGYIPWYNGNRFSPLIWARSRKNPDAICGFELETTMLIAKLIPLFPEQLPRYFRIELLDAKDKVIYAAGGEPSKNKAETALIMPFSEQLLPNYQLRAYLLTDQLPRNAFQSVLWMQLASLCLIILLAGGIALHLIRKQLKLARQKTNFVSQVSHELKTPLTSIRMYSEMLKERSEGLPDAKRKRYLKVIGEESERLARLVDNVLDFGRLDSGRKKYNPVPVRLNEFLTRTCANANELVKNSGMEIRLTLPEETVAVPLDRDSLTQILHNLFDNACKYAAEGKYIDVKLTSGSILVKDHGPGIPVRAREKIFRQFYRVDNSLAAENSGSGLGLAIARRLMRDQGGDLILDQGDDGACFKIVLPEDRIHEQTKTGNNNHAELQNPDRGR